MVKVREVLIVREPFLNVRWIGYTDDKFSGNFWGFALLRKGLSNSSVSKLETVYFFSVP